MKNLFIHLLCAVWILSIGSIAVADPHKDESGKGKGHEKHSHKRDRDYNRDFDDKNHSSYFHDHGYTKLDIPPGHYPPPGECRVWFPGKPPGHQPPPGSCGSVPPGAWLIRHPHDKPDHVHVTVYEPHHHDKIRAVGEFSIGSGALIRVILEP